MRLSNFAVATVRQSTVARHNGCLGGADMRIALHLRTLHRSNGFSLLATLFCLVIFLSLVPCLLYFSCLASAVERSWSHVFDVQKKRRRRFRKRRLGVHVFTVRYSIRFVYQAWLSWIALLSHCKVTADVVGCKGAVSIVDQWRP